MQGLTLLSAPRSWEHNYSQGSRALKSRTPAECGVLNGEFQVLSELQGRQTAAPRWVSPARSRCPGLQSPLLSGVSYTPPLELLEGKIRRLHGLHTFNSNLLHPGPQTNPCLFQQMSRSLDQPRPCHKHQFNTCPSAFWGSPL